MIKHSDHVPDDDVPKDEVPQDNDLVQSSFLSDFIKQNSPVVDKTPLIRCLLKERMGSYLLCRPRRFGKTLLLDTIENIFRGKRHLFRNLAIGQEGSKFDWKIFPVIRLDMSGTHSSVDMLSKDLIFKLSSIAKNHQVQIETINETAAISDLITEVSNKHIAFSKENNLIIDEDDPQNIILLIDEYDFPLQANFLDFEKSKELKILLRVFFSAIKSLQNRIRFALITGITKFDELALSSGMNNVKDISYNPRYSQICGFTIDEIRTTFGTYLQPTLDEMKKNGDMGDNATIDHLIGKFERWYDGYSWDGLKKVLNPRSVMDCLNEKKFDEYWKNTGPSLMFDQLGVRPENYFKIFIDDLTISKNVSINESKSIYNDNAIMLMTGYLTIDSIDDSGTSTMYRLRIPNYEIKKVIKDAILSRKTSSRTLDDPLGLRNPKYMKFYDAFCGRNEQECEKLFSSFIASASYEYNLSSEPFFTFLLSMCLDIGRHKTALEVHTTKGRSDVTLLTPDGDWMIIELKHEKPSNPREHVKLSFSRINEDTGHSGCDHRPNHSDDTVPLAEDCPSLENEAAPLTESEVSPVLVVGEVPKNAAVSLEKNVSAAFQQIVKKVYSLPFVGRDARVWAVAIAIYDSTFVKIRFRQAVWKDDTKTHIELHR
ncbi:MAG: AAA family ATPase [Deltaproteobacteria bacterium]|nr:AAA family ATPase [Deltaproteobacteria bacterium]